MKNEKTKIKNEKQNGKNKFYRAEIFNFGKNSIEKQNNKMKIKKRKRKLKIEK